MFTNFIKYLEENDFKIVERYNNGVSFLNEKWVRYLINLSTIIASNFYLIYMSDLKSLDEVSTASYICLSIAISILAELLYIKNQYTLSLFVFFYLFLTSFINFLYPFVFYSIYDFSQTISLFLWHLKNTTKYVVKFLDIYLYSFYSMCITTFYYKIVKEYYPPIKLLILNTFILYISFLLSGPYLMVTLLFGISFLLTKNYLKNNRSNFKKSSIVVLSFIYSLIIFTENIIFGQPEFKSNNFSYSLVIMLIIICLALDENDLKLVFYKTIYKWLLLFFVIVIMVITPQTNFKIMLSVLALALLVLILLFREKKTS